MERLLEAVVAAEVDRFGSGADAPVTDFDSFRTALVGFGARLLAFLSDPETIRFSHMMREEARRTPEATKLYFDAAYDGTAARIAALIAQGAPFAKCRVVLPDMGERYMAALNGHRYEMAVPGLVETPYAQPEETSASCFDGWFVPCSS